jgi:hypothetical protein
MSTQIPQTPFLKRAYINIVPLLEKGGVRSGFSISKKKSLIEAGS